MDVTTTNLLRVTQKVTCSYKFLDTQEVHDKKLYHVLQEVTTSYITSRYTGSYMQFEVITIHRKVYDKKLYHGTQGITSIVSLHTGSYTMKLLLRVYYDRNLY